MGARVLQTGGMQGRGGSNAEFLDAASLCRHLVPDGSVHAFLADHRRRLFPDAFFEDLFPTGRGRPSVPADVVATVMVLQALEGLSDREAGEAWRRDIAWKAAAGLAVTDEGFHPTVLTYWRARLRASARPERIFDAVREVITETGVLAGKSRRALDSTVLDDAVATQDTVTQLVAAIRRVRRVVPAATTIELRAHDYEQAGKPECAWDDPDAKDALVTGLVNDALALLDAIEPTMLNTEQADALGLLALVAGQDVEPGDDEGAWRIARGTAPDRVISIVDPESRHVHKSVRGYRDGYKAHIAVEPETGLVTATALTPGNAPDRPASSSSPVTNPASRSWPTPPMAPVRPASRYAPPNTTRRSNPSLGATPACRARSPRTTSSSTSISAGSRAPPDTPRSSIVAARRSSVRAVAPARYGSAARPAAPDERSCCIPTRTSSSPRTNASAIPSSSPATDAGGPWSNDPSPGSSPTATAASATAASNATITGARYASPRSTFAASSTSACITSNAGVSPPQQRARGSDKTRDDSTAQNHLRDPAHTLNAPALRSGQSTPGSTTNLRPARLPIDAFFSRLLAPLRAPLLALEVADQLRVGL